MRTFTFVGLSILLATSSGLFLPFETLAQGDAATQTTPNIFETTLGENGSATLEISTEDLQILLEARSVTLLDTRPHLEWAISHIPGALNVAPKPGMPMSLYTSDVAEIGRLINEDKSAPLVLYCNGLFCGKTKRVSEDLFKAGYTNVRRYQLGAPVWRALGGIMVAESDGIKYVLEKDQTAVFIDAREAADFQTSTLQNARNIPRSKVLPGKDVGEIKAAKDDGRLPMEDHNTRVIVFGRDLQQAKEVAEAIAREAFHNVSYYEGTVELLFASLRK